MRIRRRRSQAVSVGGVAIGGGAPVSVQSMTNTPTSDARATIAQIGSLARAGAQIVRVSVPDEASASTLHSIAAESCVPLVADIHFRHDLAIAAVDAGISKLRINPGNIRRPADVRAVAEKAASKGIPIRIGINSGSIPGDIRERFGTGSDALWAAAERHLRMLDETGFTDTVISLKASDPMTTVEANLRAARECDRPLHLGVTEAGPSLGGAVRSSVAMALLLARGIGDTIRVSLSGPPEDEPFVAWEILSSLGLGSIHPRLVSCPTCARTRIDVAGLAEEVSGMLRGMRGSFTVAVMGCEVNGPGEARDADFAVIGSPAGVILFEGGRRLPGTVSPGEVRARISEELERLARQHGGPLS